MLSILQGSINATDIGKLIPLFIIEHFRVHLINITDIDVNTAAHSRTFQGSPDWLVYLQSLLSFLKLK